MYEITTRNLLEELGEDFKKILSKLSFEKAAKGYKKMSNAEWNRVFMIQIEKHGKAINNDELRKKKEHGSLH